MFALEAVCKHTYTPAYTCVAYMRVIDKCQRLMDVCMPACMHPCTQGVATYVLLEIRI